MNYVLRKKKCSLNFVVVFFLSIIFVSLFKIPNVLAAEVSLSANNPTIKVGDEFVVNFFLNTENESLNAIEGSVVFPADLLELKEIQDGSSIISFWSEHPQVSGNQVHFSGVIPGGYNGRQGYIFSMVFKARAKGSENIKISSATVLHNDGHGTPATIKISDFSFVISSAASETGSGSGGNKFITSAYADSQPPESFTPQISQDQTIFSGQHFLVFTTQDKASGIDHYEVCEGSRPCVKADNLYLLQNQNLDEPITVKAIDKNGNQRIATIQPQKQKFWYLKYLYSVIIILAPVFAYIIWGLCKRR